MKTSLLINVEHPDDVSASTFIDVAIKSVLKDIDADLQKGWSVTTPSTEELKELALRSAIDLCSPDYEEGLSNKEILEAIENGDRNLITLYERFDNWDNVDIVDYVENLADSIHLTYF